MSTNMWRVAPRTFRIQTDDPKIVRVLSRRKTMKLVAWGVNKYLRVYENTNLRPDNARRMLSHIMSYETK
jgi:hypothetical protein